MYIFVGAKILCGFVVITATKIFNIFGFLVTNPVVYRISALGIVGDLLKKVGALELKLV